MNRMFTRGACGLMVSMGLALVPQQALAGQSYAAWSGYSPISIRGANEYIPGESCDATAADLDGDGAVDRVTITLQTSTDAPRRFAFASTRTGRPLEPGVYRGAMPYDVEGRPEMAFGNSEICVNSGAGSFEVLDAQFDTTTAEPRVVSFWARYELQCNLEGSSFKGEVAFDMPELPRVAFVRTSANAKSLAIYGERIESAASLLVDDAPVAFEVDPAGGITARVSRLAAGRHEVRVAGPDGYIGPPFAFTVGDDPPFAKGLFKLTSDPGDTIGNGATYRFRNKPMDIQANLDLDGYPVRIVIRAITPEKEFDLLISSEKIGSPLSVGAYRDAMRHPFEDAGKPGMVLTASGRPGCNEILGNFTITSYGLDDRLLARIRWIALNFDMHCDGNAPGLRGSTRMIGPEPILILSASYLSSTETLRVRTTGLTSNVELWVDGKRLGPTTIEGDVLVLSGHKLAPGQHLIGVYRTGPLQFEFSQPWLLRV